MARYPRTPRGPLSTREGLSALQAELDGLGRPGASGRREVTPLTREIAQQMVRDAYSLESPLAALEAIDEDRSDGGAGRGDRGAGAGAAGSRGVVA